MTRFYYDTEFIEIPTRWGNAYDLISIGIVCEDDREFYAVNADMDVAQLLANPWLVENVRPTLPQRIKPSGARCRCINGWHLDHDHPDVRPRAQLGRAVADFLLSGPTPPELWADHVAHDHVVLTGLFGGMGDLPAGIPQFTHELAMGIEELRGRGRANAEPTQDAGLHHALEDARHARDLASWLGSSW